MKFTSNCNEAEYIEKMVTLTRMHVRTTGGILGCFHRADTEQVYIATKQCTNSALKTVDAPQRIKLITPTYTILTSPIQYGCQRRLVGCRAVNRIILISTADDNIATRERDEFKLQAA